MLSKFKFILLIVAISYADFDWQDNGLPVRQGNHVEWLRTGDVGENGEMIFAWSDTRYGGRDIYAQKIDSNGQILWNPGGVLIVDAPGRQEDPILISDNNGGAYIMWKDYRDEPDDGDFYAQYIQSDGTIVWDSYPTGVPLTTVSGPQVSPNMSGDGAGGAFAIWNDKSTGTGTFGHVYGTHLSPNGVINEGVGVALNTSGYEHAGVSIEIASSGSAIMVWSDNRNSNQGLGNDIYAQRIDSSGNLLWSDASEGGIMIYSGLGQQAHAKVTYYSEEASVIVWDDNRNNPDTEDIYAQFVDMNGNVLFEEEIGVSVEDARQYRPRVKSDSSSAYVIWSDTRFNTQTPALNDLFMQRLTLENGLEWETSVPVCAEQTGDQTQARLGSSNSGGVFVTWMDDRNEENFDDIFIQHLNQDGSFSFDADGISISTASGLQMNPLVRSDGSDGAFFVWGDFRSGSLGIYSQRVSISSGSQFESDGQLYVSGLGGNTISEYSYRPKSLYLGDDEVLLYWVDQRSGVFGQYNYGQKIFSGWDSNQSISGTKLSNNNKADFPLAENLGNDIMVGFPDAEGSLEGPGVKYQILNENLDIQGDDQGTLISQTGDPQSVNKFDMVYASNDNLYFAYSEQQFFAIYNIFLQKFDSSGNPVFGTPISVVSDFMADKNVRAIDEIPNTGIIIVYDTESFMGSSVKAVAVDYDGNVIDGWEDGINLCSNSSNQQFKGIAKTSNGFYVVWKDYRGDGNDIYGQLIDFNGNLLGNEDGVSIAVENSDQANPSITYNEQLDELMVCWEDYRSGVYYDIYCKPINGQSLVVGDEIHIANSSFNQKSPYVYSTLDGSYIIAWQDSRNDAGENFAPDDDIYLQVVSNNQFVYAQNGIAVCNEQFSQTYPQIDLYDATNNSYIVYWNDKRSSGKEDLVNIYAQSITIEEAACDIGDVNGDGLVNVIDIVVLVNIIFGESASDSQLCASDTNADGLINVLDVVNLVNYILSI